MGSTILGEEHTERQVKTYLEKAAHDVELVVDTLELGPGMADAEVRRYADEHDRLILTSDKGYLAVEESKHAGLLFQPNDNLSAYQISAIIAEIEQHLSQASIADTVYVKRDWLKPR